jgi:putative oxidoreductase
MTTKDTKVHEGRGTQYHGGVTIAWRRIFDLTLWVLQGILALAFLYFGVNKLVGREIFWMELFAKIGIGQWFRYFTGALEVVCAVLLLIPRTAGIAAALLACTMGGAVLTHLFLLRDGYASVFPAFPLLLLSLIAWRRRSDGARP